MRRRFSYADQKSHRQRSRWKILWAFVFFFFYISLTSLFFSTRVLENDTMAGNLRSGERFILSSYTVNSFIYGYNPEKGSLPFRRGNVVLVDMFREKRPGILYLVFDGVLRFFTFQRFDLIDQKEHVFVKRVMEIISSRNENVKGEPLGEEEIQTED